MGGVFQWLRYGDSMHDFFRGAGMSARYHALHWALEQTKLPGFTDTGWHGEP